jgi:NifU-like protein involved in Fe-S cluster formation
MYSALLLDHFDNPRNAGDLPEANVRVRVDNPVCADVLELSLIVNGGTIDDVRFKIKGCVPSVACASRLTELLMGARIDEVSVTVKDLTYSLGGLPRASAHAAQLSIDALKMAQREAIRLARSAAQHV